MNALDYIRMSSSPSAWLCRLQERASNYQSELVEAYKQIDTMRAERDAANEVVKFLRRDLDGMHTANEHMYRDMRAATVEAERLRWDLWEATR